MYPVLAQVLVSSQTQHEPSCNNSVIRFNSRKSVVSVTIESTVFPLLV